MSIEIERGACVEHASRGAFAVAFFWSSRRAHGKFSPLANPDTERDERAEASSSKTIRNQTSTELRPE
jgi:hypothetical protein